MQHSQHGLIQSGWPLQIPVLLMSLELTSILTKMEMAGIKIDVEELDRIEDELNQRVKKLGPSLHKMAANALGDTPFNLNSIDNLSELIYSRHVNDKKMWAGVFQLGSQSRGAVKKARRPRTMTRTQFRRAVRLLTTPIYKTIARQCDDCTGTGTYQQYKADGEPYKLRTKCRHCGSSGVVYKCTDEIAGFNISPVSSQLVRSAGFATDSETLQEIIKQEGITNEARTFITNLVDYRETNKYQTFIDGLRRAIRPDGFIHCSFMQTVTATGRLSSQNPNFHNQPRGATFPIRRVVVSRWREGCITDADYAQIEFRVAAQLSGCEKARAAILENKDVHSDTATILTNAGQNTDRQEAKAHTFKPLYGGTSGSPAERTYYATFLDDLYPGIKLWHERLLDTVVSRGSLSLPSGRIYKFPTARRFPSGGVSGATQIKNYPVQGFATADIVPLATICVAYKYNQLALQSVLINEVHDSIVTDTHPDERDIVAKVNKEVMEEIATEIHRRFKYDFTIPLKVDVKQGPNWLDVETVL